MNFVELFQIGGFPLVLFVVFVYSQFRIIKYFVEQIQELNIERKETITKFDEALNNHCKFVAESLLKQENAFQKLSVTIEQMRLR